MDGKEDEEVGEGRGEVEGSSGRASQDKLKRPGFEAKAAGPIIALPATGSPLHG